MDPGYWSRLKDIFHQMMERDESEWSSFLKEACGGDENLEKDIQKLLQAHQLASTSFMLQPVTKQVAQALDVRDIDALSQELAGEFEFLKPLGRGGMGSVFLARQLKPVNRLVALKLINQNLPEADSLARFDSERQALALMNHTHIAKIYGGGATSDNRPYFIMEHLEGQPITLYADGVRMPIRERLIMFYKVCMAVHHAHQKGVIHRDIKPANVLVVRIDGEAEPKIIDFGLAKAKDYRLIEDSFFTDSEIRLGTPSYMSPEQIDSTSAGIDTRVDVYALGVLLYQLLTGFLPFQAESNYELIIKIREEDPQKPSSRVLAADDLCQTLSAQRDTDPPTLAKQLREDLDWIVLKALEKAPNRRYQSASAMGDDIRRHLENLPVWVRPPHPTYRLWKFVRRNRLVVAGVFFVLLSLGLGVVGTSLTLMRALQVEEEERLVREGVERESARARAVSEFLRHMLESTQRGEDLEQVLDRVSASLRSEFGDQLEVKANLLNILAASYENIQRYGKARANYEEAHRIYQSLPEKLSAAFETRESLMRISNLAPKKQKDPGSTNLEGEE